MKLLRLFSSENCTQQRAVAGAFAVALLLPAACATNAPGGAASLASADTVQCRLGPSNAMADSADAKLGVYYEGRHGIYFEPCIGSDGQILTHYAYWEGPQYILLGNQESTIDPLGVGETVQRGAITFYEYAAERVVCQRNRCQSKSGFINIKDGTEMKFDLDWVGCKAGDRMEVFDFGLTLNGKQRFVACSSYQVKGEACRQAVSSFKALLASKKYPVPEGVQLADKWCD